MIRLDEEINYGDQILGHPWLHPFPGVPYPGVRGNNTSCVEVLMNSGKRIVIDGGTGLRLRGNS